MEKNCPHRFFILFSSIHGKKFAQFSQAKTFLQTMALTILDSDQKYNNNKEMFKQSGKQVS